MITDMEMDLLRIQAKNLLMEVVCSLTGRRNAHRDGAQPAAVSFVSGIFTG